MVGESLLVSQLAFLGAMLAEVVVFAMDPYDSLSGSLVQLVRRGGSGLATASFLLVHQYGS